MSLPNGGLHADTPLEEAISGEGIQYTVEESPPWHMTIMLGFQVCLILLFHLWSLSERQKDRCHDLNFGIEVKWKDI